MLPTAILNLIIMNTDVANYQLQRSKYKLRAVSLHFSGTYAFHNETKNARATRDMDCNEELLGSHEAQNSKADIQ